MTGKEKCRILRDIRRKIAEENNIPYPPDECEYEGEDCPGTCPRCEMELVYLEMTVKQRRQMGEKVVLESLADQSLDFHTVSEPVSEEAADEMPWYEWADWNPSAETCLAMSKAGIVTVGDLMRCVPSALEEEYGLSSAEVDRLEEMLEKMGLGWKKVRIRGRNRQNRGMMRNPRRSR